MLSKGLENGRRNRKGASVMSTLAGLTMGLRLFCSAVAVLGQIFSAKTESADFS